MDSVVPSAPVAPVMSTVLPIALVISWDTASWSLKALRPETAADPVPDRKAAVTAAVTTLTRPTRG
ncbi:hypothetical protein ACTMUQ_38540 [Streptomyces sp. SD11]|uniref:hypothetical protein n=1 Tax=Streptomyces sp. SD11 TaxID=3452209 RepID=UPI003F8CC778